MKIKAKLKGQQLIVKIKFPSNEELNTRELETLVQRNIRGFLKPKIIKKNLIEYIGPPAVTLKEYLQSGLSSYEFYYVIAQITDVYRKAEKNNLFANNVILTNQYIYVNPSTQEVLFLYAPRLSNHILLDLRSFLNEVAYLTNINRSEDYHCIPNFYNFLTQTPHFTINAVEDYISKQNHQIALFIQKNIAGSGYFFNQNVQAESVVNIPSINCYQNGNVLNKNDIYDKSMIDLNKDSYMPTTKLDTSSFSLEDSYFQNATVPLSENPFLIRINTQEKILINKSVFRLGKDRYSVDYCVMDNRAVSRSHADIITRQGRYFIFDQASLNKTFINNNEIPVKQEIEIHDGDEIKLGNEIFVFHLHD